LGKIVATIEARMSSKRFPGKVLKKLDGMPSLELQIRRMRRSCLIDKIVLATTNKDTDDIIADFAKDLGVHVFRGSEEDVLSRILGAAQSVEGDLQVQTTGDCPLIDPTIIDEIIQTFLDDRHQLDFVSNGIELTFPNGLACRVFPVSVLEEIDKLCDDPIHRVHGTTFIYTGSGKKSYRIKNVPAPFKLEHPEWRWCLDTHEDLEFLNAVCRHFGKRKTEFSALELASWLENNPDIIAINSHVRKKPFHEG
jgi:spore coat polysaccharide biosynthesis protein SpsF